MKSMRLQLAAVLMLVGVAVWAQEQSPEDVVAVRLNAYIEAEYGPFIRDLAHVRLGHQACAYSFVDDAALAQLYTQQVDQISRRGAELIAESAAAAELEEAARDYAARLAAETALAVSLGAVQAVLTADYGSGEADCALSAEANRPRYQALQVYAMP